MPVSYGPGWALTRDGLLGAGQNGLGIVRMAGLAWADVTAVRAFALPVLAALALVSASGWRRPRPPPSRPSGRRPRRRTSGPASTSASRSRSATPIDRVELLLTFADAIGPTVTEVPFPPTAGGATLTYKLETGGQRHLIPNTPIVARWRVFPASDPAARRRSGPRSASSTPTTGSTGRPSPATSSASTGTRAARRSAAKALKLGEDEVRDTSKLLGVTETEPVDFFVYANQDDFYGRSARAPTRTWSADGVRLHPDAARAHPARPDRRPAGRRPHPARVRPPRVRHGVDEPVPRPAALAQRRARRSTRARATAATTAAPSRRPPRPARSSRSTA